jgi:hypothetical protein
MIKEIITLTINIDVVRDGYVAVFQLIKE